MRFDAKRAKFCFENNDEKELINLGYHYCTNSTYVDPHEYADLVCLINTILDYVYDVDSRDVQEAFIMMIHNAINCHAPVCSQMQECLEKMEHIINSGKLDDWELAETLLVLSCTMNPKYIGLMNRYKDYEDSYVREVVKEYLYDLSFSKNLQN